jgi:hypothetical protein
MWYLQFHFVCDNRVCRSFERPPFDIVCRWQTANLLYQKDFYFIITAESSFEPHD